MRLGLRTILIIVSVILFLLAAITDDNAFDFLAFGLAVFAASFVIEDLVGGMGSRTTTTTDNR